MNFFINPISSPAIFILFDDEKNILYTDSVDIKGNESSKFVTAIDHFLKKCNSSYNNLKNIVLVNGPGSFTGVRTAVLAVNTISYIKKSIFLTDLSYFDLFSDYPIIKSSSKRDCFFQEDTDSKIEIVANDDIVNLTKKAYGEAKIKNVEIFEKINYSDIIKKIEFKKEKILNPLYIKKPNIC